jgi:hypothetical protein
MCCDFLNNIFFSEYHATGTENWHRSLSDSESPGCGNCHHVDEHDIQQQLEVVLGAEEDNDDEDADYDDLSIHPLRMKTSHLTMEALTPNVHRKTVYIFELVLR